MTINLDSTPLRHYLEQMRDDIEAARDEHKIASELNQITAGKHYKGQYQREASRRQKEMREKKERDKAGKQEKLDRRRRYAELVGEMFPPTVDPAKEAEIDKIKDRLQHPVKKYSERKAEEPGKGLAEKRAMRRAMDPSAGDREGHLPRPRLPRQRGAAPSKSPSPGRSRGGEGGGRRGSIRGEDRDPLSVGMAPGLRLSDFPPGGVAHVKGGRTPRTHRNPDDSYAAVSGAGGFYDLSPARVRLSEGLSSGGYNPGGGGVAPGRAGLGRSALGIADVELGEMEQDLQKQSQESSQMMAAIMARLNAIET